MKEAYCHVTVNALHPGVVNTDLYKHTNIVCRIGKYLGGRLLKVYWTRLSARLHVNLYMFNYFVSYDTV